MFAQDAETDYTNRLDFGEWKTDNYATAPFDMDPATWALLMRQSVAKGQHTFEGPDISRPYPTGDSGSMKDMDWGIRVDLATNISLQWAPNEDDVFDNESYVSGGVLSLSPTEGELSEELEEAFYPHPSWKVCAYYPIIGLLWREGDQNDVQKKDNCGQVVPEDCLSAFRTKIVTQMSHNSSEAAEDADRCPIMTSPPEPCPRQSDDYSLIWNSTLFRMEHAQPNRNGTYPVLGPWSFDNDTLDDITDTQYAPSSNEGGRDAPPPYKNGSALFQWASLQDDAGNQTQLEEIGLATPLLAIFGINNTWINENAEDDYSGGNAQSPHKEFICSEATDPTVGYLDEVPQLGTGLKTSITGWAVGLVARAFAMMLA